MKNVYLTMADSGSHRTVPVLREILRGGRIWTRRIHPSVVRHRTGGGFHDGLADHVDGLLDLVVSRSSTPGHQAMVVVCRHQFTDRSFVRLPTFFSMLEPSPSSGRSKPCSSIS